MKITEKALKEVIQKAVKKHLTESSDFTARRKILLKAREASMDFEDQIVDYLDLMKPDDMPEEQQRVYHAIAKKMESRIVNAVAETIIELSRSQLSKNTPPPAANANNQR